jgi:primosomal replication protein N
MNRMVLSAQLLERGAVRYTPAGLPAIDCRLCHESAVTEDGQPRRVSLEIKALAIGAMSRPLGAMALGSAGMFAGFLASARNGRGLLFHITELTPDATAVDSTPDPSSDSTPTVRLSAPI